VLDITAIYKSYPTLRFSPKKYKTTSRIDIKSFEELMRLTELDKKAAEQLEQMRNPWRNS